jgi:hypothetical protein
MGLDIPRRSRARLLQPPSSRTPLFAVRFVVITSGRQRGCLRGARIRFFSHLPGKLGVLMPLFSTHRQTPTLIHLSLHRPRKSRDRKIKKKSNPSTRGVCFLIFPCTISAFSFAWGLPDLRFPFHSVLGIPTKERSRWRLDGCITLFLSSPLQIVKKYTSPPSKDSNGSRKKVSKTGKERRKKNKGKQQIPLGTRWRENPPSSTLFRCQ